MAAGHADAGRVRILTRGGTGMDALQSVSEAQLDMRRVERQRDSDRSSQDRVDDARTEQRREHTRREVARSHEHGRGDHVDRYA